MNHYLTPEETGVCNSVQATVKDARSAIDAIFLAIATNKPPGGWPDGIVKHALDACETANAAIGSLDFQTQGEWMGGDSCDPANFKTRRPDGFRRFGVY